MDPWDRLPGEEDSDWKSWVDYRDQILFRPKRELRNPLKENQDRSRRFNWSERARLYDEWCDKVRLSARLSEIEAVEKTAAKECRSLLESTMELTRREVAKFLESSVQSEMPISNRIGDLEKLINLSVKLSRLLNGETTENIGTTDDLSAVPLDEIRRLKERFAKKADKS